MILAKRQYILQLICCCIFSLGMTICFWMVKPSSTLPAILLLFVYVAYSITECVFVWKRCNFAKLSCPLHRKNFLRWLYPCCCVSSSTSYPVQRLISILMAWWSCSFSMCRFSLLRRCLQWRKKELKKKQNGANCFSGEILLCFAHRR